MATNLPTQVPAAVTNDIRDIKPPVEIPSELGWLLTVAAILVVTVLCYIIWRLIRKRLKEKPPLPPEPAHVRARRRLMEALALIAQPEPFVVAVSGAVRVYLEERFNLHAPERTTEEFLHELADSLVLTERQKASLGDFLTRSDLVKFARYEPTESELRDMHAAALRLIEETKPVEEKAENEVRQSESTPTPHVGSSNAKHATAHVVLPMAGGRPENLNRVL